MAARRYYLDEDSVECAICLESYIGKDPRVLLCQHIYCLQCLIDLPVAESQITCPKCREKCKLPQGKVSNLRRSLIANSFREVASSEKVDRKQKKKGSCLCKVNKEDSLLYCNTHNVGNICASCIEENHFNCEIWPQMKKVKRDEKIKSYLEDEKINREKIEQKLDKKKNDFIRKIEEDFEKIKGEFQIATIERQNELHKILDHTNLDEPLSKRIEKLLQLKPTVEILNDIRVDYRLDVTSVKDCPLNDKPNSSHSEAETPFVIKYLTGQTTVPVNIAENRDFINTFTRLCNKIAESSYTVTEINLEDRFLSEDESRKIGNIIKKFNRLQKIDLTGNDEMRDGLSEICKGLVQSSTTLKECHLSFCNITISQAKHFGNMLQKCSKIEKLDFSGNNQTENELEYICNGLVKSSNTLKVIDFGSCDLDNNQSTIIAKLLQKCSKIEEINLSMNENMGKGLQKICDSLIQSSNTLKEIDFSDCNLTETQAGNIGNMLKKLSKIESINLHNNVNMGNGLINICNGLVQSSNTLKYLNLGKCNLSKIQAAKIGKMLQNCSAINSIDLNYSNCMENGLIDICYGLLQSSNTLKLLYLVNCNINESQATKIGVLLKTCSKMENINLTKNCCMGNGVLKICDGLSQSKNSLKFIDMKHCNLTKQQSEKFKYLFEPYGISLNL
ncbi:unnamed protein product [Dimorphilus gyrociliatus]|uniref:RING-type domain-containing protein n=1 Tax=Dimorphilus gyrociliatus TaxID=2664684 RepID=A0A7I8WFT0_9ANNE|nr:unnamed protein product [Dimorphilus gyrociliatus]